MLPVDKTPLWKCGDDLFPPEIIGKLTTIRFWRVRLNLIPAHRLR
jgi:hypothetical protein